MNFRHLVDRYSKRFRFRKAASIAAGSQPGELSWLCNICGTHNKSLAAEMDRESGVCSRCRSVMRFRCIAAVLAKCLFGEIRILSGLQENKELKGLGMSDEQSYANVLKEKLDYTNTFFHCEPRLDITRPDSRWLSGYDFVIASDVFEHVPPPVQLAFDNLFSLLKPGGSVIFSVPFTLEESTREHYPNLYKFKVVKDSNEEWVLENETLDGKHERFRNLVFHGGPGATLEMRLFSLDSLKKHFAAAGFTDVRVHDESHFEHGIFWLHPWSLVISARKPQ